MSAPSGCYQITLQLLPDVAQLLALHAALEQLRVREGAQFGLQFCESFHGMKVTR